MAIFNVTIVYVGRSHWDVTTVDPGLPTSQTRWNARIQESIPQNQRVEINSGGNNLYVSENRTTSLPYTMLRSSAVSLSVG